MTTTCSRSLKTFQRWVHPEDLVVIGLLAAEEALTSRPQTIPTKEKSCRSQTVSRS